MCICCLHYRRLIIHHQIWNSVWNCKIQWNFPKCKVRGHHKTDGELPQEVSIQAKSPVGRFGDRPGVRDGCCRTMSLWSKMVIFCCKYMVMSISTFMQRVTHFSKTYSVSKIVPNNQKKGYPICALQQPNWATQSSFQGALYSLLLVISYDCKQIHIEPQ